MQYSISREQGRSLHVYNDINIPKHIIKEITKQYPYCVQEGITYF